MIYQAIMKPLITSYKPYIKVALSKSMKHMAEAMWFKQVWVRYFIVDVVITVIGIINRSFNLSCFIVIEKNYGMSNGQRDLQKNTVAWCWKSSCVSVSHQALRWDDRKLRSQRRSGCQHHRRRAGRSGSASKPWRPRLSPDHEKTPHSAGSAWSSWTGSLWGKDGDVDRSLCATGRLLCCFRVF